MDLAGIPEFTVSAMQDEDFVEEGSLRVNGLHAFHGKAVAINY